MPSGALAGGVSAAYVKADRFARSGSCPPMPIALLNDRALISVSGPDAEHFLQNIVTTDLDTLAAGEAKPGALLTPQGKILFDFLISRGGENGFRLECRADVADDFVRRLMLYKLRAKVEIAKQDQALVAVAWGDDSSASQTDSTCACATARFADAGGLALAMATHADGGDPAAWQALPHRQRHRRKRHRLCSLATPSRMTCCSTRPAASASRRAAMSARRSSRACSIAAPRGGAC